ncbi:MAG: preprotein translocase subunit SecE [Terriglobia bacterium]
MAEEPGITKNTFRQVRDYFSDVRGEMRRVTWPSKQEIYGTTVMVVLTTFIFAFYFAICDWGFRHFVGNILDYFLRGR